MKLSELKNHLSEIQEISIWLEDGTAVPKYFHLTEVGLLTRNFIDCGGTIREEKKVNLQLWVEDQDKDHRLTSEKALRIIESSEKLFPLEDLEVEVEFQQKTIGKFGLSFQFNQFILTNTQTACLATDACGVLAQKQKLQFSELVNSNQNESSSCTPGGGCC